MSNEEIANPGSALGEAVGAVIERRLNNILKPIAEECGCIYISTGPKNLKTGEPTKLLLRDNAGNKFNIDAVIATKDLKPLVLIESKYIRYKKHNRDKASWVCTAHYSLRRKFSSIRKSIAVLAGSWSKTSKYLLKSWDIDLFEISFADVVSVLRARGIEYDWKEKEKERAATAWRIWSSLGEEEREKIGLELLQPIEQSLRNSLRAAISTAVPREIKEIEILTKTNLGEMKVHIFKTLAEAQQFLNSLTIERLLDHSDSPTILE